MIQCVNICVYIYTGIYTESLFIWTWSLFIWTFLNAYIEAFFIDTLYFSNNNIHQYSISWFSEHWYTHDGI